MAPTPTTEPQEVVGALGYLYNHVYRFERAWSSVLDSYDTLWVMNIPTCCHQKSNVQVLSLTNCE